MLIPQAVVQAAASGGLFSAYALLTHEESNGVDGGTFTSGSYAASTLNTEKFDTGNIVSLSSNQFTLGAGTYYIKAWTQAYHVRNFKCRIQNVTDGTTSGIGSNGRAYDSNENHGYSFVACRITIVGSKTFELQARCDTTTATFGFGVAASFAEAEVYSHVEIWKEV